MSRLAPGLGKAVAMLLALTAARAAAPGHRIHRHAQAAWGGRPATGRHGRHGDRAGAIRATGRAASNLVMSCTPSPGTVLGRGWARHPARLRHRTWLATAG